MRRLTSEGMRFVIVGAGSNAALFVLYLLLTTTVIGHKTSMTVIFMVGLVQTFFLNRRWTFRYESNSGCSFWRYVAAYCVAYLLNLAALSFFVDWLGAPHALVQGIAIPIVAAGLFLAQRYWVFAEPERSSGSDSRAAVETTR